MPKRMTAKEKEELHKQHLDSMYSLVSQIAADVFSKCKPLKIAGQDTSFVVLPIEYHHDMMGVLKQLDQAKKGYQRVAKAARKKDEPCQAVPVTPSSKS